MKISKKYSFDAAHMLPRHKGKCGHLHGHTYEIEVRIDGPINDNTQFVLDYAELDALVKPLVISFDHRYLNFLIRYPSAENIATFIGHFLWQEIIGTDISRLMISVSETSKTIAIWDSGNSEDFRRISGMVKSTDEWRQPNKQQLCDAADQVKEYMGNWLQAHWKNHDE